MLKKINFHSRVLLCFVAILTLALSGAAIAMYVGANRASLNLAQQQLLVASRVTRQELESRDQVLREATGTIAADFGFREALSSGDGPTIRSALENHGARLHADVAAFMDKAGVLTLSTDSEFGPADRTALEGALHPAHAHNESPLILSIQGRLFQLVVVPVNAPDRIGWFGSGFYISDELVEQIKETTGTETSFIAGPADGRAVVASTLPSNARESLLARLSDKRNDEQKDGVILGPEYLTLLVPGATAQGQAYTVALQISMATVSAPLIAWRNHLLLSGGIILALSLIAAVLCARLLARPVQALTDAARSLSMSKRGAGGGRDDELAHVAHAFHSLVRRAHYDALTGLPNRTLFNERLSQALERSTRSKSTLAVVFIDLNGFKAINDTLGHEMGDRVLRKTAQRLSRSIVPPHTAARLGGDEFVLILENVGELQATLLVEHLMKVVSTPMKANEAPIKVGMSAGIAMFPTLATDRELLLKHADAAMYESKARSGVVVVAKPGDRPVETAPIPTLIPVAGKRPAAGAYLDTVSGHWQGNDLSTQPIKVFKVIDRKTTGV